MTKKKVFIGRKEELGQLNGLSNLKRSTLVVIKGRRRIGKSRLAAEFAKDKIFLPFAGMAPVEGVTVQNQYDAFANTIASLFHLPPLKFSDWLDGFAHISHNLSDKPTVILFDEISWMGSKDLTFLPKLKIWWDRLSEQRSNIVLILCGSISTWIEENIIKSTAFFGRISLHINLLPLSILESYQLIQALNIKASSYDSFRILSITGGVPWYLENIQSNISIDENIKSICFSPNGLLVNEFNLIFHDLFTRSGDLYKKIVSSLANGMKDYKEIRESIGYSEGGIVATYLDSLINSGYVTKHNSWKIKTGKAGAKSLFRLSDNYLRFYLKVIEPVFNRVNMGAFKDIALSTIPGWNSIIGLQVENLLLSNRSILLKSIGIHPEDVIADNPFYQNKTKSLHGVQIDYLIQTSTNTLYLCEFKFSRNMLGPEIIKDIQDKIKKLHIPRGFAICPVLFHFGAVSDSVIDKQYFYRIIDINDFLGLSV